MKLSSFGELVMNSLTRSNHKIPNLVPILTLKHTTSKTQQYRDITNHNSPSSHLLEIHTIILLTHET